MWNVSKASRDSHGDHIDCFVGGVLALVVGLEAVRLRHFVGNSATGLVVGGLTEYL